MKLPEVIWLDDSWYPTRSPIGIHILNPTKAQLAAVIALAAQRKHLTLYCYKHIKVK